MYLPTVFEALVNEPSCKYQHETGGFHHNDPGGQAMCEILPTRIIVVVSPNLRRRLSTELTKATDGDLRSASGFSRWQSVQFHSSVQNSILECKNRQLFGEFTTWLKNVSGFMDAPYEEVVHRATA